MAPDLPKTVSDFFELGRELQRGIQVLAVLTAACVLAIPAAHYALGNSPMFPVELLALGVILFAVYLACRKVRHYVVAERLHLPLLAREAQVQGASAVADTFRHQVGNKLAIAVGYCELLLDDPRLPEEVHEEARRVLASNLAAARAMHAVDPRQLDLYITDSPTRRLISQVPPG